MTMNGQYIEQDGWTCGRANGETLALGVGHWMCGCFVSCYTNTNIGLTVQREKCQLLLMHEKSQASSARIGKWKRKSLILIRAVSRWVDDLPVLISSYLIVHTNPRLERHW